MKPRTVFIASPVTLAVAFGGAYALHKTHHHDYELIPFIIGLVVFMALTLMIFEESK